MNPVNPDTPVNPFSVPECVFWSNTPTSSLTLYEFLTFSWTSKLKLLLVKAFLEDCLPEILSKVGVLAGRPMKKSERWFKRPWETVEIWLQRSYVATRLPSYEAR